MGQVIDPLSPLMTVNLGVAKFTARKYPFVLDLNVRNVVAMIRETLE